MLICSNVYAPIALGLSKTLGLSGLTITTTPHPFSWAGVTREQIRERAASVFEHVVNGLTGLSAGDPNSKTGARDR